MAEILVVDDEAAIADLVEVCLKNEGYTVYKCGSGEAALTCVARQHLDLAILDVMLPDLDGFTLCQKIREEHLFPILMLTARVEDMDKIMGLTLGADDYISKPYNSAELIARVKAQLRRSHMWGSQMPKEDKDRLVNGGLVLDKRQRIAIVDGQETRLTAKEYSILLLLMEHPGQVFSAEQIYEHVWEESADFAVENTVMVHIRHIREKIEIDTKNPRYVKVVWGLGYKMEKYV